MFERFSDTLGISWSPSVIFMDHQGISITKIDNLWAKLEAGLLDGKICANVMDGRRALKVPQIDLCSPTK